MSTAEEVLKSRNIPRRQSEPAAMRLLNLISSVRFGVIQLCLLVVLAMIGMLIIQQNVQGFDSAYATMTPAEKYVYGTLGFFDIYHSWYFNLVLLILSLNIILASIDHFPAAWSYLKSPKKFATRAWLMAQKDHEIIDFHTASDQSAAEKVEEVFRSNGFRASVSQQEIASYELDENGRKDYSKIVKSQNYYVFGESGRINRLGAYIIHVFLLTLFLGFFVAQQTGFDADVNVAPGQTTNQIELIQFNLDRKERFAVQLPFQILCTDIQQTLINPQGEIGVSNTLDWRTQIKISDPEYGETVTDVSLNNPFTYRGYRFFQAQTIPIGHARTMKFELTPANGGDKLTVELMRNGATALPDGTKIEYSDFFADFAFSNGKPDTRSGEYNNPAAALLVTPPGGEAVKVFAFANKLPDNAPINAPKAGYRWRLAEFEKTPLAHVLSIKYDPFNAAFIAWYIGGFGLIGALGFIFFTSHRRIWALIERSQNGEFQIVLGGNANRNHFGFQDKFNAVAENLRRNENL